MNSTATLQEESSQTGALSSPVAGGSCEIIYREFGVARPLPLPGTTSLSSLLTEFEGEPEMSAHLAEARRNLAVEMYADEPETLSAMRLTAGLSQAQLAARAGTTQSYIARIEHGQVDPGTGMITRISEALGADAAMTFRAVITQRNTRG